MDRNSLELELYTIPSYSSWFSWNNIHEVERFSLREFFDGTSITRSPRIYKEYRDFIISKFRENPSKKLTFTEVRKSLVGDISVLLKVFTFLDKWGLVNFNVGDSSSKEKIDAEEEEEEKFKGSVKVEEGAPYGVRVVAAPNSMKPIAAPAPPPSLVVDGGRAVGIVGEDGFRWPPLASYSDVYGELMEQEKKGLVCGSCKENCDSAYYEYQKEGDFVLCEKCFTSGNYDKNKYTDDFKLKSSNNEGVVWTEAETLLLLESVIKHGDEWDLVSKNVQTKSKLDCISKLMQLPFGDLMLGSVLRKSTDLDKIDDINNNSKQAESASNDPQESLMAEDESNELKDKDQQNEDASPPQKRLCTRREAPEVGSSLMKQVARISAMLGPQVTASAAEAAVTTLCYDNQCSKEMFDDYDNYDDPNASPETSDENRSANVDNANQDERSNKTEIQGNIIPLNLRTRAATATALGAAAANAKLLADQEEREMGQLVATVIEAQLKKVHRKMKYFEDLEIIMEKEHVQLEELEESLVSERLEVLERVLSAGVNKSREHTIVKYPTDGGHQN